MKVFLDYSQEELDRQYEHRHFVADVDQYVAWARAESARVRSEARGRYDVPYGAQRDETLDVYFGEGVGLRPLVVFFHGGRWSRGSKTSSCYNAEVFTALGAHFVSVNFTLLPDTTMDVLIHQCRSALAWLWRNADSVGGDRARIYVMGKSSGAHIAGMMVTTDWEKDYGLPPDVIKAGLLVSGMYDLEPVRRSFRNSFLRLDEKSAKRNSPIHRIPADGCPLVVGCGALETDEFRRQSQEFAGAWRDGGNPVRHLEVAGCHHYSVSTAEGMAPLMAAMGAYMGLPTEPDANAED